jgi:uncharacterized LabA/DUF88 family protein
MIKHKSQRVGVFIDVQNMYYSARKLYGHKVNFGEILKAAEADRQLIRAIAYVVRATGDEGGFFEALHARGMETKMRDVQIFEDGARKADWDVGMAVDAIRIGEILDVVVLVTGDGDFIELVEYLKHHGRQVEVVAFKETTSAKLIAAADDFVNLSEDTDRFLIGATAVEPDRPRRPQGTPKNRPAVAPAKPVVAAARPAKPASKPVAVNAANVRTQPHVRQALRLSQPAVKPVPKPQPNQRQVNQPKNVQRPAQQRPQPQKGQAPSGHRNQPLARPGQRPPNPGRRSYSSGPV